MPDEVSVTVVGFDELRYGTAELFDRIEKDANHDLEEVARERAALVRAAVPRLTGRLAASVSSDGANVGIGDPSTPYAGWIEFGGTRGRPYMPQGRYLYPIAFAAGTEVQRDLTKTTKQTIKGFTWPPPLPTE